MSHGRSEPAELHVLKKQVTGAKEGPLELRRKKTKIMHLREERGKERGAHMREGERERLPRVFFFRGGSQ